MHQSISRAFLILASATALFTSGAASATAIAAEEPQQSHHIRKLQTYTASDNYQAAMLKAVNAERAKQGLAPFCANKKLQAAAQLHSDDQAKNNFMSHTGSNGSQMSARITAQSFIWSSIAENVAAGQVDVTAVMTAWMGSDGHRANILGNYKFFGTGYAYNSASTYKHYWTQDFGTGANEACDSDGTATPTATPTPVPTTAAPVVQLTTSTAATQTTATPTATAPASGTSIQVQMLNAVNAERAAQGLAPFCANKKLQAAAQLHSDDQAKNNFMSHTGSNGSQMSARITAQNFAWTGIAENVAAGQIDVTSVVKSWMASSGHRANILGNYKYFGMGYAYNAQATYKHYWTQDFGSSSKEVCDSDGTVTQTAAPVVTPAPTTPKPTTVTPVTSAPTTPKPTTAAPVTSAPTTPKPTTAAPVTPAPTTPKPTTPAPTTPTPTTTAPASGTSIQVQMLNAVNAERAAQGLAPFCANKKLQAAAQLHSDDQAKNNFMSHTGSNGSQMGQRITAQGFSWTGVAENVAAGQVDVASVVKSWMNSSGHRANILGSYTFFGMGYAYNAASTYKHYWTQDFGTGAAEKCD